jgi:hypothetical protein
MESKKLFGDLPFGAKFITKSEDSKDTKRYIMIRIPITQDGEWNSIRLCDGGLGIISPETEVIEIE